MTDLPSGWRSAALGDVVAASYGKALPVGDRAVDAQFPIVGSAGRLETRSRTPLVAGPALVVGRKGNVGQVLFEPGGCWPLDTTYYLTVPPAVFDLRFLMYQLISLDLRSLDSSTAIPSLRRQDLERQRLAIPPLREQQGIVEILEDHLSRLDAANEYLAASSTRVRTHSAAILSALATPDDPVTTLASVAEDSRYGTSTKCTHGGSGVPVVRIPNLQSGAIDLTDEKRAPSTDDLSSLMLRADDLLIVRTNGSKDLIGRTAVVQPGVEAAFASYLIRYRLDRSRALPRWVHLMLERPEGRRQLESLAASSAGQYNLGLKKLNGVEIPLPTVAEQRARIETYTEVAGHTGPLASVLVASRGRSDALRRSLLTAAFSGRLTGRSSDLDLDLAEEMAFA